jgi:hypothetical protein
LLTLEVVGGELEHFGIRDVAAALAVVVKRNVAQMQYARNDAYNCD